MLIFSFLLTNIWPKSVLKISSTENFGDELLFKDASLTLLRNMEAEFLTDFPYSCILCSTPGKRTAEIKELLSKTAAKQHKNIWCRKNSLRVNRKLLFQRLESTTNSVAKLIILVRIGPDFWILSGRWQCKWTVLCSVFTLKSQSAVTYVTVVFKT